MQRQPTPRNDPNKMGHVMCQEDALVSAANDILALTDLTDLRSMALEKKRAGNKEKTERGKDICKATGMRSWEGKKVRCVVVCFSCGKPCCIFLS